MRREHRGRSLPLGLGLALTLIAAPAFAQSGGAYARRAWRPAYRRPAVVVPTQARSDLSPSPMLGTFYPTPFMMVGGNGFSGGNGYTPMQQYGDGAMALYGPFSSLRAVSAPVATYSRGYDGIVRPSIGNATSYPFLPPAGAVVYPTRAVERGSFGYQRTPPWWDAGYNWVDFD